MQIQVSSQPDHFYRCFIEPHEREALKKELRIVAWRCVATFSDARLHHEQLDMAIQLCTRLQQTLEEKNWVIIGCIDLYSNAPFYAVRDRDSGATILKPYMRHICAAHDFLVCQADQINSLPPYR